MSVEKEVFAQALQQSNFRAIFENQREKLVEVFKGDCIYSFNGGFFLLGPLLFSEIAMYIDGDQEAGIILDINYNPIQIDDLTEFLSTVRSAYTEALNKYKLGLARLKKSRQVPTLTKLHDLEDDVEE